MQELIIELRILVTTLLQVQFTSDRGTYTEVRYDTHHLSSADGLC